MAGLRQQVATQPSWEDVVADCNPDIKIPTVKTNGHAPQGPTTPINGARPRLDRLVRVVESAIIPQLVVAWRAAPPAPLDAAAGAAAPRPEEVAELAGIVLGEPAGMAAAYVESVQARGAPLDALYLDLLAPAARHLGELWQADLCDFTEVTVALGRLQQVLRGFSPAFLGDARAPRPGRRALLVPVPGSQHTFGLNMVVEFFRRAGWDVWSGPMRSGQQLVGVVRRRSFAVVGISVGAESQLDAVAAAIRAIRRYSRNRAIAVMVGGPVFAGQPDLVARVGADATAVDGREATRHAENLLDLVPERR